MHMFIIIYYHMQDGCVLTFSPCVGLIRKKKDKYDEIPP